MEFESGFSVAGREVIPLEGRIGSARGVLRVEPKAMAVLLELARHAPGVRSRMQIEQAVWPRGYVSEDALTRCIGQLRRALGDDPRAPRVIETIPRRGYRLCAAPAPPARAVPDAPPHPRAAVETLLVLPFRHLAAQREDFLAEGLTELLILRLCGLRGLRILSRTTAMQFAATTASVAEIAARTGAGWIVEGSILQAGERVQIVAQLIDARSDTHIWAADYTHGLKDLLAMQNDIAERVAAAIRAKLGVAGAPAPTKPRPPLAASGVRDYLRGRHLMSRRTVAALRDAIEAFAAVTVEQPDFAPAWASRAECLNAPIQGSAADIMKVAMLGVDRALREAGASSRMLLQVHDELVLEVPDRELARVRAELPSLMTGVAALSVPLAVEVGAGRNWDEAH